MAPKKKRKKAFIYEEGLAFFQSAMEKRQTGGNIFNSKDLDVPDDASDGSDDIETQLT